MSILSLTLVLPNTVLSWKKAPETVFVQPDNASVQNCQTRNCYSLSEIIKDDIFSNISNTTIVFLPGTHSIFTSVDKIVVINSNNFTLKASDSNKDVTILCSGPFGFKFKSCSDMTITGITFKDCGAHTEPYPRELMNQPFALYIHFSSDITLKHISIINGSGIGLVVENTQHLLLVNSVIAKCYTSVFIMLYDHNATTSNLTNIQIDNCIFTSYSRPSLVHNSRQFYDPFGLILMLKQTQFHASIYFNNVNLSLGSMFIRMNKCNNILKFLCIRSMNENEWTDIGFIYSRVSQSSSCIPTTMEIDRAWFTGEGLKIQVPNHAANDTYNSNYSLIFSNIYIRYSQKIMDVSMISNVTFINTTITKSNQIYKKYINFVVTRSQVNILGFFSFSFCTGMMLLNHLTNLSIYNTKVVFHSISSQDSPLYVVNSIIEIFSSSVLFENNTGGECGGITLLRSSIIFHGKSDMHFIDNSGKRGGAMAFYYSSCLVFKHGTTKLTFTRNDASIVGGGIFVQDFDYLQVSYSIRKGYYKKFFKGSKNGNNIFTFMNNTAAQAGSALYGGIGNSKDLSFDNSDTTDLSVGATNPNKVCLCIDSVPNCSNIVPPHIDILPGQTHEFEVAAVGEWDGTVPSNIQVVLGLQIERAGITLKEDEYIQSVSKSCSKLKYTLQLSQLTRLRTISIKPQIISSYHSFTTFHKLRLVLHIRNCTIGFNFDKYSKQCICNRVLFEHGIECDIQSLTVRRSSPKWINATFTYLPLGDLSSGVLVHDHCPFGVCKSTAEEVQPLNLNYPDEQCAFNRSGILCGGCESNFSLVLGTPRCRQCDNRWIPLVIIVCSLIGIFLVVGLSFLNITVSHGTVNELIFYANIMAANSTIFFPHTSPNSLYRTFIAWLNLDLGIELCFYNGMDAYSKTWLQFLFPLYIWLIVVAIIYISRHSSKFSRLLGNNAVQVLATLFLLSYAKLLRLVITIFSSTTIIYPDHYIKRVWLYDGNVDFLQGRHIPLFIAALLLLVCVSLPYSAMLFSIQWFQRFSHMKLFSLVGSLLPLFDAYTGPYKHKHRYWTGLLLFVRVILFLIFSLNTLGDPTINLLSIAVCMFSLLTYLSITGGVYKRLLLNFVECSFILNLGVLSAGGLYIVAVGTSITPISLSLVSIAFVLFVTIIIYHFTLKCSNLITNLMKQLKSCIKRKKTASSGISVNTAKEDQLTVALVSSQDVTYSEVVLQ